MSLYGVIGYHVTLSEGRLAMISSRAYTAYIADAGPAPKTMGRRQPNIGPTRCVC